MNNPYGRERPLSVADRAAWARYEAEAARAAEQYRDMPISVHHAKHGHACADCGALTITNHDQCRNCRTKETR